ncbi:MAG: nucleotidyltransferase domain-containing protein [Chitinophagales bacterium]
MEQLTENQIQKIVDVIVKGYKPEKVILFGSYANGTPGEWSDLDFMIIKKTRERHIRRPLKVMDLFDPYPHAMDILVYTPPEFVKYRKKNGTLAKIANDEGRLMYGN